MLPRFTGAVLRAGWVLLVVMTPALLLPVRGATTPLLLILVGGFATLLTFLEYSSSAPSMIHFRDAPPFNRLRAFAFFLCLSTAAASHRAVAGEDSVLVQFITSIGFLFGYVLDFPGSPLRMLLLVLTADAPAEIVQAVTASAGLGCVVMVATILGFAVTTRLRGWPMRGTTFNFWINLPNFDPTTGGDIVERLNREVAINHMLGFMLLFLLPVVMRGFFQVADPLALVSPQPLVWIVTLWIMLPTSLFMRGFALRRVAQMIAARRAIDERPPADFLAV